MIAVMVLCEQIPVRRVDFLRGGFSSSESIIPGTSGSEAKSAHASVRWCGVLLYWTVLDAAFQLQRGSHPPYSSAGNGTRRRIVQLKIPGQGPCI